MTLQDSMPVSWVNSDEGKETEQTSVNIFQNTSVTIEEDKSQPPTPDGTGLPTNFHMVGPGIYRSSYPQPAHFDKLKQYRFKTIVTFVPGEIPYANAAFMAEHGIVHHHIQVLAHKEPGVFTTTAIVVDVLKVMLDKRKHPILIHCNKGKHRTGCMAACFRKVTGWTEDACIGEYEKYSQPKDRAPDKQFIRSFVATVELKAFALDNGFVGGAFAQPYPESSRDSERTFGTVDSDQSAVTVL